MELKIQKTDKVIIIFYVFLAIAFTIGISYIASTFDTTEHVIKFPEPVTELQITKIVGVNQEKAFLIMTDVKNYPKILPKSIISVNIINQIDNSILAEYEVIEHGIRAKLLANHTLYPYDRHIIEVMDGDAEGTKLIQDFTMPEALRECNSPFDECTKIDSRVELNLKGLLSPFSYLPKGNLDHASNTVITSFTTYMEIKTTNEKIIDDLYREILQRPADTEAFEYWGSLLDSGTMTAEEIRTEILNSDERKYLLTTQERKTVEELDDETKKIIDDLYREILQRPADTEAFEYWGSLFESEKITNLELRKTILKSQEALALKIYGTEILSVYSIFHEVYELNGPYNEEVMSPGYGTYSSTGLNLYDPRIDHDELNKIISEYQYLLKIEGITLDEIRLELEQLKENGIDFFVDDLESVNEQYLDWKKCFVDKTQKFSTWGNIDNTTDDFCYSCKWSNASD